MKHTKEFLEKHENMVVDEATFKGLLLCMQEEKLTKAKLQADHWLYQDVSAMTIHYLLSSGFRGKNKKLLAGIDTDLLCAACSVGMNLLLSMDRILACDSGIMSFVQTLINRRVIDLVRSYFHEHPVMPDQDGINQPLLISLGDEMSALLQDESLSVEELLIEKETKEERHRTLLMTLQKLEKLPRFDVTSLLATRVLELCPHELAELIDNHGLLAMSSLVIKLSDKALHTNSIPTVFANDDTPAYTSTDELAFLVTKVSNRSQTKVCKLCGKVRPVKKHSAKVPEAVAQASLSGKSPQSKKHSR